MRMIVMIAAVGMLVLAAGCNGQHDVLLDSDVQYLIPAGTPFKAKETKDGPLIEFVKDTNMAVVHPGYLVKLQNEADAATLQPP